MEFKDEMPADAAVVKGFSELKRKGGSVLVVGAVVASHVDICRRFLSGDSEQILVRTEGSNRVDSDEIDPTAVIDRPVQTRSAAQSVSPTTPDLNSLRRDLQLEMERLADGNSSLRVSFNSLRPFVDTTDIPSLVSFLETMRETAQETDAIVYFHLPATVEAVPSGLFDGVDAVVKLARREQTTYQQWYLPSMDETTEWVEV